MSSVRTVVRVKLLVLASIIAALPLLITYAVAENKLAEATLWGIYGAHSRHDCPVNNKETAKEVIALSKRDLGALMEK